MGQIEHNVRSKKNCNGKRQARKWLAISYYCRLGSKSTFVTVVFLSRQSTFEKDMSKEVLYLPRRNT